MTHTQQSRTRRPIVVTLILALVSGLLTLTATPASAAITLDQFVTNYNGKRIGDPNGYYVGECVSLVKRYHTEVLGGSSFTIPNGAASGMWTQFSQIPALKNTYNQVDKSQGAKRGDLAVFSGGTWGHVAIVLSDAPGNPGSLHVFEQNSPIGTASKVTTNRSTANLLGFLRPKNGLPGGASPFGWVDLVTSPEPGKLRVAGWTIDPDSKTTSLNVHIYIGGQVGQQHASMVASTTANLSRPDVAAAHPGSGDKHGFDITFTAATGTYPVCTYAINVGPGPAATLLECHNVTVANPNPFGYMGDLLSPEPGKIRVNGWAIDPNNMTAPLDIHVYIRGQAGQPGATMIGSTHANRNSADVAAAHPGSSGKNRFDATFTAAGGTYPVCAYAINIGPGSHTLLECRSITVAAALTAPTPTISGTAKVGATLTASPGTWGPAPVTLKYQWKADGKTIASATKSTLKLATSLKGKKITVTVTGSKTGYTTVTKTSTATAAVAAGTLTAPAPKVTGTAKVGAALTAKPGSWGPAPVALKYQWKADGKTIAGATKSTLKLTSSLKGKKITVTVTGSKTGYTTVAKTSAATAAVTG